MNYIIDTHVWYWGIHAPDRLPKGARQILFDPDHAPVGLVVVSLWELAKLVEAGRIDLEMPLLSWFDRALNPDFVTVLPLTPDLVAQATQLPGKYPSDPFDQLIVAAALLHEATLITADKRIAKYHHVISYWK